MPSSHCSATRPAEVSTRSPCSSGRVGSSGSACPLDETTLTSPWARVTTAASSSSTSGVGVGAATGEGRKKAARCAG